MSVQKECEHCGKAFKTPNRRSETVKFCSWRCRKESGWLTLECGVCGTEFRRKKSDASRFERPYCSSECYHKGAVGQPVPGRPKVQKAQITCAHCKSVFLVIPSRRDKARFCSRKCQSLSPEWRVTCSEAQQGEKSWRWKGGAYKSKSGYIRHKRKVLDSEEAIWPHRQVIFEALLKAEPGHPFLILVNGKKRLDPDVEVHHIDRNRSNNDLSNLLAVTKTAHAQIHHRNRKPLPSECWPRNPAKY